MNGTNSQRELARQAFLEEANTYAHFSSPLFSALARACTDDDDMATLWSAARPGQPATLFFCAVHYLLLKSPEDKLGQYFPSVTANPRPPEQAFPAFKEFCLDRREEFKALLATRTVNANLVEKAVCLLPAAQYLSRLTQQPLTLLEICCSAGMNLIFDEYQYDYGAFGKVGAEDSPVRLECKVVGGVRPPIDSIPQIVKRVGVDLVKPDLSSPLDRLWMEAVLCPEWKVEREHLKAALPLRMKHDIQTFVGDAVELVPPLLEELPGTLCVLLSYCLGQWSEPAKVELDQILRRASRNRDIHRLDIDMLHNESPRSIRGRMAKVASNGISLQQKCFPSRIEHTWYTGAQAKANMLAYGDGFGVWLDWLGTKQ